MSIQDFAELPNGYSLQTDLCIVGAGAAGIAMALQFIGTGIEVLLVEAGGRAEESETQSLYAGSVANEKLHSPPDRYRQRRFGGTTTIWGGRCMPFDPIDFDRREYVADSGWPFSRDELMPYYADANRLCEAGEFAYTIDRAFDKPTRPIIEGFESDNFTTDTLERFSCPTDFGARYGHKLVAARNIRVLLHANVTDLKLDGNGTAIIAVEARDFLGKHISVRARQYVLATGGLEVARLLLANRDVQQDGIGNEHGVVGRFYMCHIAGTVGSIKVTGPPSSVWHGYDVADDGTYCRRRFALREPAQRTHQLGNFIARLHHPRITDPRHRDPVLSLLFLSKYLIPYEYRIRLHGSEPTTLAMFLQHLRNVLLGPADTAAFAIHMLRDRKLAERKFPSLIIKSKANLYSIDFHAEQRPNWLSRVTLGDQVDAFGMRRLHIDWRYTAEDVDTVSRSIALLSEDFRLRSLGTFEYDPSTLEEEITRYGAYGGHHIGTARMGNDSRSSVVNSDCRVHGVRNLYIASAATFPTSSQANPTLTIIALSLRLAAHIKATMVRPVPSSSTGPVHTEPAQPPSHPA